MEEVKKKMRNSIRKKGLVIAIIMLFILLGSLPSIGGKRDKNLNRNNTIILSKNIQNQPLGITTQRFLQTKINITIYGNYTVSYDEMGYDFYNVYLQIEDYLEESRQSPVCRIYCEPNFRFRFEKTYFEFFNCNILYLENAKTNLTMPNDPDGGYMEGKALILIIRGW